MTQFTHIRIVLFATIFSLSQALSADIVVVNAYIPKLPPASMAMAAYLTLTNQGTEPLNITGVQAEGFKMAHLHQSKMADGISSMHAIHQLSIEPGETLVMQPGGLHIMLMKPEKHALASGEVALAVLLDNGDTVNVMATVRASN